MAHYLARLMTEAEAATGEEREALERRCFDAVLAVWKHRNCLPEGLRPFEPAERLLGIVEALDPDAPRPFYSTAAMQWDDLDPPDRPTDAEADRFDLVRKFDHAARMVIRHLLGSAVEDLPEDTREWVRRAQNAGAEGVDIATIRHLILASDSSATERVLHDGQIRKWQARLAELDRFMEVAENVRSDLECRLVQAERANMISDS
jgi:hypothetical protein